MENTKERVSKLKDRIKLGLSVLAEGKTTFVREHYFDDHVRMTVDYTPIDGKRMTLDFELSYEQDWKGVPARIVIQFVTFRLEDTLYQKATA